MAKKTKEIFVRILCGVLAGMFVLGCIASLAII